MAYLFQRIDIFQPSSSGVLNSSSYIQWLVVYIQDKSSR